jgi:hypothetical protein
MGGSLSNTALLMADISSQQFKLPDQHTGRL